jgi:hypothetical protein
MLDGKMIDDMPRGTRFAAGVFMPTLHNIVMPEIRWVAVRGNAPDWAIYAMAKRETMGFFSFPSDDRIAEEGDKVFDEAVIRLLVPCDDEALARYRL